jgi:hypothetical protein
MTKFSRQKSPKFIIISELFDPQSRASPFVAIFIPLPMQQRLTEKNLQYRIRLLSRLKILQPKLFEGFRAGHFIFIPTALPFRLISLSLPFEKSRRFKISALILDNPKLFIIYNAYISPGDANFKFSN